MEKHNSGKHSLSCSGRNALSLPFLFFSRRSDIANLGSILIEKISGHYKEHCLLYESLSRPSMDITRRFNLGSRYILQPKAAIQLQIWLTAQYATRLFKRKLSSIRSLQKEARNLATFSAFRRQGKLHVLLASTRVLHNTRVSEATR